jgi:D-xylonolactonase
MPPSGRAHAGRRLSRRELLRLAALGLLAGCTPRSRTEPTSTPTPTPAPTPTATPDAALEPELVVDTRCALGEGPLWHPLERRVYWVDIPNGRLFRYDPATGEHEVAFESDLALGGATVQEDGALLLFMEHGAIQRWHGGEVTPIFERLPGEEASRFNDVIADPEGRVFCGTMPTPERLGRLYRLDPDRTLTPLLDGIGVSNGLGFSPDLATLYYTDSPTREIYAFDYDRATGALANQRVFVRTPAGEGVPDGLTVDAEGYVWSARWDGGVLVRYSPEGEEVQRIAFPARKVTSAIFGGPDESELYVTTAGGDDRAREGEGAGALFRLRPDVRGKPGFFSRIVPPG